MPFDNILLAVDTTEEAEEVTRVAREVAGYNNSAISVVTVVKPLSEYLGNYYSFPDDGMGKKIETQAEEYATAWLSELAERHNIDAEAAYVIVGKPSAEIRRLAEKLSVDLIVIGTHGRHGMGLMLGSTANGVLHGTQCSVLAVRVHSNGSQ